MKRILFCMCLLFFILSTTTFAHVRTASEPEWDGYYSLTNQTVTKPFWGGARLQYGFTKYTNGEYTEYWFRLDKNKDELIEVEFQGCKNTIQIKDKQISIIEADCPDKTCVNMGILKSAFTPIVCLPNHLVIQYVNDDKEIDATVN